MQEQLKDYLQKLKNLEPQYFIEPQYETPSGFINKIPNPLLVFLTDTAPELKQGSLNVLLAEPGQGKTYTTQFLTSELLKKDKIPIYISALQWEKMPEEELSSIWKTLTNSFRYYESNIDWIEGCEQSFIDVTLKAGLFKIIFDGFDEYILWNRGKVNALEIIKILENLAEETKAQILLTSRTIFWENNISSENHVSSFFLYKIIPFDINHATNYFTKRFNNDTLKVNRACEYYKILSNQTYLNNSSNFAGRGFILFLLADLCETPYSMLPSEINASIIHLLMEALCKREEIRQKLPINAYQQISIFKDLAEEISQGSFPDMEFFKFLIGCNTSEISEAQINDLITGSLKDHPLIKRNNVFDKWEFIHEQIYYNLLAEQLIIYIELKNYVKLENFFMKLVETGSILYELSSIIVERAFIDKKRSPKEIIIDTVKTLSKINRNANNNVPEKIRCERVICSQIILLTLAKTHPVGKDDKKTRTEKFIEFSQSGVLNKISNMHFSNTISNMDFSNTEFEYCLFDNVNWTSDKFSEKTQFKHCKFIGGNFNNCPQFGFIKLSDNCVLDHFAKLVIYPAMTSAGKRLYTEEDLKNDIDSLLKKFSNKIGFGFKPVELEKLSKGSIQQSIHRDLILDYFGKFIIEKKNSTKDQLEYSIREDAKSAIQHYLSNGIFTGCLKVLKDELLRKILK